MGRSPSEHASGAVAHGLTIRYRRAATAAVDDVTLRFDNGVNALVGRNGAGKTTLLNAIVTMQRVHAGQLSVLGVNLPATERDRLQLMRQVGFLPQQFGYIPGFTVQEFLEYAAWLKRVPTTARPEFIADALALVDLTAHRRTKLGRLSGGMLRRAGIASAVVHRPRLLALDEPTAGLDPEQRIRFRDTLRGLAADRCVVISSHLIEDVKAIADHVLVMEGGRAVFAGSVPEMLAEEDPKMPGDTPLERAYTALVQRANQTRQASA